jgi:hypothetical protein
MGSWLDTLGSPSRFGLKFKLNAVMKSASPTLPKFNVFGTKGKPSPVFRAVYEIWMDGLNPFKLRFHGVS